MKDYTPMLKKGAIVGLVVAVIIGIIWVVLASRE